MEESGARLNRDWLASAYLLIGSLAARPATETWLQSGIRPRAGAIQEAVIAVLTAAEQPLHARQVHGAAENLARTSLSWNTVKDCLHKNARRPDGLIERVSHGCYRPRSVRSQPS